MGTATVARSLRRRLRRRTLCVALGLAAAWTLGCERDPEAAPHEAAPAASDRSPSAASGETESSVASETAAPSASLERPEVERAGDEHDDDGLTDLAGRVLCEVSAAVPARGGSGWWLADNERHDRLFIVTKPRGGGVDPRSGTLLGLPRERGLDDAGAGPRDIEALAIDDERLVVVGSHSRNKRCERKRKRQRIRLYDAPERLADPLVQIATVDTDLERVLASPDICIENLLVEGLAAGDRLCEHLVAADTSATEASCLAPNIEGAVLVADALWLGLRAPLYEGRALLLAADLDALRAGELRVRDWRQLDLDGQGVRELSLGPDGNLVGIAGPELDADTDHQLFTVDLAGLRSGEPGARVDAALGVALPSSSEGLVRLDAGWIALVDGAEGDDEDGRCDEPSRQLYVPDQEAVRD